MLYYFIHATPTELLFTANMKNHHKLVFFSSPLSNLILLFVIKTAKKNVL
jgi:hypothetical protein